MPERKGSIHSLNEPAKSIDLLRQTFGTVSDVIRSHATERPNHIGLRMGDARLTYSQLNSLMDRIAASLQRSELNQGDVVAFCAATSIEYIAAFLAAVRAGLVAAPLPVTAADADLAAMVLDSDAKLIFVDQAAAERLDACATGSSIARVLLSDDGGPRFFYRWAIDSEAHQISALLDPDDPFNIIYSSGTTGTPKGIVQSHRMRWAHMKRALALKYDRSCVTMIATPPYSNLTLVNLLMTLAAGGTAVLMATFDARGFLALAELVRATHTFLVPVQFRRMLDVPEFPCFDLSAFTVTICGGAPCSPEFKAEMLSRWPGEFVELFGLTEGGATCLLFAREHRDKLHTVGRPIQDHDMRIVKDDGSEAGPLEVGEVVGRSAGMMTGYHHHPDKTRQVEWYDSSGNRFIRSGDLGRFDEDGFLILVGRKKEMIISGGANVYPSDLEEILCKHEAVSEAAVVGVPSREWGETPVGFVVLHAGMKADAEQIRAWANGRLGKTQRLAALKIIDDFPRSAVGKPVKSTLRELALENKDSARLSYEANS
jgi:long-chain acyl-CoA synthetase